MRGWAEAALNRTTSNEVEGVHKKAESAVRVELKYCEHCGGLWVREGGAGVYCEKCESKVADLPVPKKKPGKVKLPVRTHTIVDDFEMEFPDDILPDLEGMGGVA